LKEAIRTQFQNLAQTRAFFFFSLYDFLHSNAAAAAAAAQI
jgi:hypothetical protein